MCDNIDIVFILDLFEDEKVRLIYLKYFKDFLVFLFMDYFDLGGLFIRILIFFL